MFRVFRIVVFPDFWVLGVFRVCVFKYFCDLVCLVACMVIETPILLMILLRRLVMIMMMTMMIAS